MFRTKLTLAGLAVAALVGAVAPGAFAAHDSWYSYATSLTNTQRHDPWFAYAVSLSEAQPSARFITDTLAPGGSTPAQSYRLITDTLAPGGTAPAQSYRFVTDTLAPGGTAPAQSYRFITDTLAPGGGPSVVSAPVSNGFDWADAGIGAGATAGIALLLLASGRVLQSRRRVVAV